MAVIAMASAKGSPGVTTNALALALTWPRDVLLVEADPAGGDVMAGYVRAELRNDRGLGYLAVAARHDRIADEFGNQVVDLGQRRGSVSRLLLPGINEPAEAAGVAPAWPVLTGFFARLGAPGVPDPRDVIVDCGRLSVAYPPKALLASADLILLVVRTSLRSAASAATAVTLLRRELAASGGDPERISLIVVEGGEYRPADVSRSLGAPILVTMPWREREAAALSDGIGRAPDSSPLIRAARTAAEAVVRRFSRVSGTPTGARPQPVPSPAPGLPSAGLPSAGRPPVDHPPDLRSAEQRLADQRAAYAMAEGRTGEQRVVDPRGTDPRGFSQYPVDQRSLGQRLNGEPVPGLSAGTVER